MSNQSLRRSNEPIFWGLFGAGGMWSAVFTPALLLCLCLLLPLGMLPGGAMDYERVLELSRTVIGRMFLFFMIALPLWCGLHRICHGMHDLKLRSPLVPLFCYGLALVLTVAALAGVMLL